MGNLSDIRVKPVSINLDKERNLVFDLNAFAELEDVYGEIDDALSAIGRGSIKAVRAVLYAGLVHEDESLTVKSVGKLVTLKNLQEVSIALTDAIKQAMPQGNEVTQPAVK
jgi:hypothetical protein